MIRGKWGRPCADPFGAFPSLRAMSSEPHALDLPGPSRRIRIEPLEVPAAPPAREPDTVPEPRRNPDTEREPERAEPAREKEPAKG